MPTASSPAVDGREAVGDGRNHATGGGLRQAIASALRAAVDVREAVGDASRDDAAAGPSDAVVGELRVAVGADGTKSWTCAKPSHRRARGRAAGEREAMPKTCARPNGVDVREAIP